MPGGRLSQHDREQISAGLTGGFGYAEIGRRLGRPTSTITREVLRNGGPKVYDAVDAHSAAGQRARRTTTVGRPPAYRYDQDAVHAFQQQFITMMIQTGVPTMVARVLVHLLTTDAGSATAAELVQRLQVSPASISKAVRYLETLGLLRRERETRRERYLIPDDVLHRAWTRAAQGQQLWADTAAHGAEILDPRTPAGARLAEMGTFFGLVAHDLNRAADHWWLVLQHQREQRSVEHRSAPDRS